MAFPTVNQAISRRVFMFTTSTMRFPLAFTIPASIFPYELPSTPLSVMVMGYTSAFTISRPWWWVAISSPFPRFIYSCVGKFHNIPPLGNDYITKKPVLTQKRVYLTYGVFSIHMGHYWPYISYGFQRFGSLENSYA